MTGPAPTWLLRADASEAIGVGHVMRCLTLAEEAIARGRRCRLLSHQLPAGLVTRARSTDVEVIPLTSEPGSVADGVETAAAAHDVEALVLDGYHLGDGHRRGLIGHDGLRVGIDDNLETDPSDLDVIVNPAPHARARDYAGRARLVLLGPAYALLRREVSRLVPVERPPGPARSVVVVMGGADVGGHSHPLCEALLAATDLDVTVMTGITNPRAKALQVLAQHSSGRVRPLDPEHLPSALATADIGVIASGGTLWEAAALGLPTIAVVTADNQLALTDTPEVRSFSRVHDLRGSAGAEGVATDVAALAADALRRAEASGAATALVDGRGASRVVDAVLGVAVTHEGGPG